MKKTLWYTIVLSLMLFSCEKDNESDSQSENNNEENPSSELSIGSYHAGGVVIWIDPSNKNSGLVIALSDQSSSTPWGCGSTNPRAYGSDIGDGYQNTLNISSSCTDAAANLCSNLSLNGYNDWFMPTNLTMLEVYNNLSVINNTISTKGGNIIQDIPYWTSYTIDTKGTFATAFDFETGYSSSVYRTSSFSVRAVRKF